MERRISRVWKPAVELVERRELLSLVTNIMAGNHNAADQLAQGPRTARPGLGSAPSSERHSGPGGLEPGTSNRPVPAVDDKEDLFPPLHRSPCPRTRVFFHPPTLDTTCCSSPRAPPPRRGKTAVVHGRLQGTVRHHARRSSAASPCWSRSGRGNRQHDAAQRHPVEAGRSHRSHASDHGRLGHLRP